jgi:hypothetical protein
LGVDFENAAQATAIDENNPLQSREPAAERRRG